MHPAQSQRPQQPPAEPLAGAEQGDIADLFDPVPNDANASASAPSALATLRYAFARIGEEFAAAAARVRSLFSEKSAPLISISKPRARTIKPKLPPELEQANQQARDKLRENLAASVTSGSLFRHAAATMPSHPKREAFDAYARLCKQDGKHPGEVSIPHNFDKAAAAYASDFADRVLKSKLAQGRDLHLSSEVQIRLPIAIAVLQQQKSNPLAQSKAKALDEIGPVPVSSVQQATSFMAWRAWKQDPDNFPSDSDFCIDAAVRHASELLAQFAGQPQARLNEVKAILNDATELIAQQDEIQKRYNEQKPWREGEQLMSNLLASVEASRS